MSKRGPNPDAELEMRTQQVAPSTRRLSAERVPALTLLCHAEATRIGERATLHGLAAGESLSLSRTAPKFDHPGARSPRPLSDPFLSRDAVLSIDQRDGALIVRREHATTSVLIEGDELREARGIADDELERGVVVEVGGRCVLLLHLVDAVQGKPAPRFDLVGESDAIRRLRRDIERVAATSMRVLVRGETGSGKELAARAIHHASARSAGPFEAVNMAAIQTSLAASALFGHVRGAFSGAVADQDGHFAAAHGGTLFLDEIGDTDPAVQASLLRTLETKELVRVGDRRARKIDVRLLSATDADLEAAVASGRFREPLLHRIAELTLRVPPLRERPDDIGRLVVHVLRELLDPAEQERLLDGPIADRPWLSPSVVARLGRAPWTGNVRQLRNVVRQLVVLGRDEKRLAIGPEVEAALRSAHDRAAADGGLQQRTAAAPPQPAKRPTGRKPQDLTEEEILRALEETGWKRAAAADRLGIARSSLYALLADNPRIARSQELTREQIQAALAAHGGDVERAAAELRLSKHGLKLRMQALGVSIER